MTIPANAVSASRIPRRVFIVGCPRSGTTLLQTLLMGHSSVESFPETHFFARGLGGRRGRILGVPLKGLYQWWHLRQWRREARARGFEVPAIWPHWSRRRMAREFVGMLDRITVRRGKTVWLEKTPAHLHAAAQITRLVPDARFLHVVRDGRANVASLVDVARRHPASWPGLGDPDRCAEFWNRCVADHLRWRTDPAHRIIRFEDLVANPEDTIRPACRFLDLPYEPGMTGRHADMAPLVTTESEPWKSGNLSRIRDPGLGKYEGLFDHATRRRIERMLDRDGYRALTDPGRPARA